MSIPSPAALGSGQTAPPGHSALVCSQKNQEFLQCPPAFPAPTVTAAAFGGLGGKYSQAAAQEHQGNSSNPALAATDPGINHICRPVTALPRGAAAVSSPCFA